MPQSGRKRVSKIQFKRSEGAIPVKAKGVDNIKFFTHRFGDPNRPKEPSNLFRNILVDKLRKVRIVGGMPPKNPFGSFWGNLQKSRDVGIDKFPTRNAFLLNKKVSDPSVVTPDLLQKKHAAPRFMSILTGKGRLIRHRVTTQLLGRKIWPNQEKIARLPHAKRLQLFQVLLEEPLPFLDLHVRFGVSKQTVRGLVKNGLLTEVWGPKAIGVRFKLSKKGKNHLKELETAANYDFKMKERDFVRLKHRPLL
jgi:hypothetical protein